MQKHLTTAERKISSPTKKEKQTNKQTNKQKNDNDNSSNDSVNMNCYCHQKLFSHAIVENVTGYPKVSYM